VIAVGVGTRKHQHTEVAVSAIGQVLGKVAVAATVADHSDPVCVQPG